MKTGRKRVVIPMLCASLLALSISGCAEAPDPTLVELSPTAIIETPAPTPSPTPEPSRWPTTGEEVLPKYAKWLKRNPEVIGWIKIDGTRVDYPVLHREGDNDYYLHNDINGRESGEGCIFMDVTNSPPDQLARNTLLHGHHMKRGTMFADITKYKEREFFEENHLVRFDTLYYEMEWEVFSVHIVPGTTKMVLTRFSSDERVAEWARSMQEMSMYQTDYEPKETDMLLTLSTCSYEHPDTRTLVHARLVRIIDKES